MVAGQEALAQGNSTISGKVVDSATGKPVPNVVITITSPALQGEQIVVTDGSGFFRVPSLPAGEGYAVNAQVDAYRPHSQGGIVLRSGSTVQANILLLPETVTMTDPNVTVVIGRAPTIDVGSSRVVTTIDPEFTRRIAVNAPTSKGGAVRSFESLAATAPGTFEDTYGVSINGTTSPENGFVIDGVSASDPAFGTLGTPLSAEFVKEVNVITAGYLPEYGRAIGGIMDVVTKSGSNEFHGSLFSGITPGIFEGKRAIIPREGSTITTDPHLSSVHDFGFEFGGPIVKDKLWFFTGFTIAMQRTRLERNLNKLLFEQNAGGMPVLDAKGEPIPIIDEDTGYQRTERLPGTTRNAYASTRTMQYIAKLTWNINQDHNLALSVFGVPETAGGNGEYPFDLSGATGGVNLNGPYATMGGMNRSFSNNVILKSSSSFSNKKYLLDVTLGWVYDAVFQGAADGSGVDDVNTPGTLAYSPTVTWRRSPNRHPITDFENLPAEALAQCAPGGNMEVANVYCPVVTYNTGGAGFMREATKNRYQGRAIFTALMEGLGHHVIKAGVDFEQLQYTNARGLSGGSGFRETRDGAFWQTTTRYGFLEAPDTPVWQSKFATNSNSTTVGGFLQDSWSVMDRVTVNLGVRYDAQVITGNDGRVGMTLPNQWSPRVGVIWDPSREGRAKVFANFARFYQAITMNLVDRAMPGETTLSSYRPVSTCNPNDPNQGRSGGACDTRENLSNWGPFYGADNSYDPNQKYVVTGGDRVPVDPDLKPQSSDQFVVGGEYEIVTDARIGGAYTHQQLGNVVEDMSRDEAQTYFIGNPGRGMAKDFPSAVRDYDSLMVYFQKTFGNQWLAQASYTISSLRGNISGLFRPETGQLDPNINSDFDLVSLLSNRTGPLPGDRTHSIKVYGAKEFTLPRGISISMGGSYTGRSGTPINVLGSHPIYSTGEVFILPRGAGGRTPWVHSIDTNVTAGIDLSKGSRLTVGVDVFNLFNFQQYTGVDQDYTLADVRPIPNGTTADLPGGKGKLLYTDGSKFDDADKNPNFGKPNQYQTPRQIRLNARVTF
jgi:outer membrane receptor protein involved in Fe transport